MRLSMYVLYTSDSDMMRLCVGGVACVAHLAGARAGAAPVRVVKEEGVVTVWMWDAKFEACAPVGTMQHSTRAQASETKRVQARERYAEVQPGVSKLKRLIFLQ